MKERGETLSHSLTLFLFPHPLEERKGPAREKGESSVGLLLLLRIGPAHKDEGIGGVLSVLRANNSDSPRRGGSGVGRRPTEVKDSLIEREREGEHAFPPLGGFFFGVGLDRRQTRGNRCHLSSKVGGGRDRPTDGVRDGI